MFRNLCAGNQQRQKSPEKGKTIKFAGLSLSRLLFFRSLVFIFLATTTVIVGVYTFNTLTDSERKLYVSQYDSFSTQALQTAETTAKRHSDGARAAATQIANSFPDAAQWPFVAMNGFDEISQDMQKLWKGVGTSFLPRVQAAQLPEFNSFMNDQLSKVPNLPQRPGGYNVLKGSVDPSTGQFTIGIETTGETSWGSPYRDIFPIVQVADYSSPFSQGNLAVNLHSVLPFGAAVDVVLDCVASFSQFILDSPQQRVECGAVSDIVDVESDFLNNVIVQPVFPANNRSALAGLVVTGLKWSEILSGVVPSSISGLDFIVQSPSSTISSITYTITNGVPVFRGAGDLHDTKYDRYRRSRTLTLTDSLSPETNPYTIVMYPRKEFIEIYTTDNPRDFTIGAVFLIFLTSLAFVIYDHFMKQDSSEKADLLQTKRQFVRFISHEVRTPLNAVAMGLKVLENEFLQAVDKICAIIDGGSHREYDEKYHDIESDMANSKPAENRVACVSRNGSLLNKIQEQRVAQIEDWRQLTVDITENTASAVFVLDDLLNYDKIETGSLRLELKEVDIWELARKTVHTFELAAKQVKVNLTLQVERGCETLEKGRYTAPIKASSLTMLEEGRRINNAFDSIEEERVEAGTASQHKLIPLFDKAPPFQNADYANCINSVGEINVMGDGTRLAQVIRNLISNALKFTPEDGSVTIIAKWTADGVPKGAPREVLTQAFDIAHPRAGSIRISVTDTGAGLNEEQLANICSEGVQFNANKLQGGRGSGLGLFISKGIVEQHGGTMVVTSEGLGHGTTFTVELPLFLFPPSKSNEMTDEADCGSDNDTNTTYGHISGVHERHSSIAEHNMPCTFSDIRMLASASSEHICTRASLLLPALPPFIALETAIECNGRPLERQCGGGGEFPRNILVVDDAASNRKMLMRLLQSKGCVCTEARNGQEALEIFKNTETFLNSHYATETAAVHLRGLRTTPHYNGITGYGRKDAQIQPEVVCEAGAATAVSQFATKNALSETAHKESRKDFDAIFMDFEMPILNGPDATKLIRELGCRCLIVGITGNILPADMRHFLEQGADAVLPKPLQLNDVAHVWQNHIS